jgi:hypothetical protein
MADTRKPNAPRPPTGPMRPPSGRPQGPIAPPIYTASLKQPTNPKVEPLVTEGMKAQRRDIERKKRAARAEKLRQEEEGIVRSLRTRKILIWVALIVLAVLAYRHVQGTYGDKWPLGVVWGFMAVALLGGIGWMIWYLNRDEM